MLRVDNNAQVVCLPLTISGIFTGRWAVRSGKRVFPDRWKKVQIENVISSQEREPVPMLREHRRALWYFHDKFYWDDDSLEAEDIMALVLQRERRLQQKLNTAHSLMRSEEAGRQTRTPTTSEIRRVVFERDGGRCVECSSSFDLQYDHVLPVALGGATTIENLQLLCADCNRRKSDHL
jgi:5-methylcytosine-specific restriction endonuclease McrA